MESKVLNLPDALRLSTILGKYITEVPKGNVSDFFDLLFEKFTPEDLFETIYLLTGERLNKEVGGNELLILFYEGLTKNKIVKLMETSKELGFI